MMAPVFKEDKWSFWLISWNVEKEIQLTLTITEQKSAIQKHRRGKLLFGLILLQDNEGLHTAALLKR